VSTPDGGERLAEGPVLDILVSDGAATPVRLASPRERLLGRPNTEPGVQR
jgi:hypothetical protein